MKSCIKAASVVLPLSLLAGCGGGSSFNDDPNGPAADPEGLYAGTIADTYFNTSSRAYAIVLKSGTAKAFQHLADYAMNVPEGATLDLGTVVTTSDFTNNFSGGFTAYASPFVLFSNGSNIESGTINGTFTQSSSFSGSFSAGTDSGSVSLSYDASDYERAASLATIAGTYQFGYASGENVIYGNLTISEQGVISGTDNAGCIYNGSLSVPDASHNAYAVSETVACPDSTPGTLNGLASYFPAGTGAIVNGSNFTTNTLLAIVNSSSQGFGLVLTQ